MSCVEKQCVPVNNRDRGDDDFIQQVLNIILPLWPVIPGFSKRLEYTSPVHSIINKISVPSDISLFITGTDKSNNLTVTIRVSIFIMKHVGIKKIKNVKR